MRKILMLLLVITASCNGNLDLRPKAPVTSGEAFSNPENVYAALIGCYDALQLQHYYGRNLIITGDLASDNTVANGTKIEFYDMDNNSLLADNILVNGIWSDIYVAVNRANYMLYKLEEIDFIEEPVLNDYKGQMRFLRALHFYNLVRLYGEIPLNLLPTLTDNQEYFLPRSPVQTVYNQIIADLEFARLNITNTDKTKATVNAATALLASVYLTLENYTEVIRLCEDLLADNPFLDPSISRLYDASSDPSDEIIFYLSFSATDKNRLAEYNFPNQLGGRHENAPSPSLTQITDNDQRKSFVAMQHLDKYYSTKYSNITTGGDRVIVLRNAELYLMLAEALYRTDSVDNKSLIELNINTIRNRAGLPSLVHSANKSLLDHLEYEKQIEFAFEGKRWFDLIRTKRAFHYVSTISSNHQLLFPVPSGEIQANPNIGPENQNPGY